MDATETVALKPAEEITKAVTPYDALKARVDELVANAERWIAERKVIENEEQAKAAGLFLAQLRDALRDGEKQRKADKQPFIDAGKRVDDAYAKLATLIEKCGKAMKAKTDDWLQREQKRIEAERIEAKRKADEAARQAEEIRKAAEAAKQTGGPSIEAEAMAEEAEKDRVRAAEAARKAEKEKPKIAAGTGIRTVANVTVWELVVTDYALALEAFKDHEWVKDAVERAAKERLRGTPAEAKPTLTIPGCNITSRQESR